MKRKYNTPSCIAVSVCTTQMLAVSQNEYSSDQGHIRFNSSEVDADDAD